MLQKLTQRFRSPFCLRKLSFVTKPLGKMDFGARHLRSPELANAKDAKVIIFNAKDARDAKVIDAKDFIYRKISNRSFL